MIIEGKKKWKFSVWKSHDSWASKKTKTSPEHWASGSPCGAVEIGKTQFHLTPQFYTYLLFQALSLSQQPPCPIPRFLLFFLYKIPLLSVFLYCIVKLLPFFISNGGQAVESRLSFRYSTPGFKNFKTQFLFHLQDQPLFQL